MVLNLARRANTEMKNETESGILASFEVNFSLLFCEKL